MLYKVFISHYRLHSDAKIENIKTINEKPSTFHKHVFFIDYNYKRKHDYKLKSRTS